MNKIELLAPARNVDVGIIAIDSGADAVYIGGPDFGARAAAGNSVEDIARLCDYAHLFGARVYVTLNTILYDSELDDVEALIHRLYAVGVDALITQDLAMLSLHLPPIALHASTQMDNCTPDRARFLEQAGYSQIVLARELSLEQIEAIHAATTLPLEAFVHGALCVSYSGRCYASQYCFQRSANRGRCAQFCRLAFDLVDGDGYTLCRERHLLSLRDMNRSSSLEAMMDAGVRSFKIEGRLKDATYVKNVTAYYRAAIDDVLARRSADFCRASSGEHSFGFVPDVRRSFNRGFTDYFLHERTSDVWNFLTPKSMGMPLAEVVRVTPRFLVVLSNEVINNGDGLTFITADQRLEGFRVNRCEFMENRGGKVMLKLFLREKLHMPVGTKLNRNEDRVWENSLLQPSSAVRKLPLSVVLSETPAGFRLTMSVVRSEGKTESSCDFDVAHQVAQRPQEENVRRVLSKMGDTPFVVSDIRIMTEGERFIPASVLAEMRRSVVEQLVLALQADHLAHRDERRPEYLSLKTPKMLSYVANVANAPARDWLMAHGTDVVAPAFEIRQPSEGMLMTCRHCLRYAFGQCLKGKKNPHAEHIDSSACLGSDNARWKAPLSLRLPDGRMFPLHFDCERCEMQVMMPK